MNPNDSSGKATPIDVAIVGGGLAGLSCALRLREAGLRPLILERSGRVGGRVQTDNEDGYLLDRGFQVFLDAYPVAGQLLDLEALDLRPFRPGALVHRNGRLHRVMDVFREPLHALSSALAPIGTLKDKLLVAELKRRLHGKSPEAIAASDDITTEAWLRDFGFSEKMIDVFFRAFYGGIFLERELRTSSRMFEFTFGMFSRGSATLPAGGMGQIPAQLASRLPPECIRVNSPVLKIDRHGVTLESGERIEAAKVAVATDGETAEQLIPECIRPPVGWRSVTGLYFSAPESPLKEPIIALNGEPRGIVNNVCVLSDVCADYAPEGMALISVSVLGLPDAEDLETRVLDELREWFGDGVAQWQHLRTDRIAKALPEQAPSAAVTADFQQVNGITICGDHCATASIEGALISGRKAAEAMLAD